jgi:hypothetical protein
MGCIRESALAQQQLLLRFEWSCVDWVRERIHFQHQNGLQIHFMRPITVGDGLQIIM